jgi:hypothetical protein
MEKVFVEYAIAQTYLDVYRTFMEAKRRGERFEWYEGTDQPGLFVEVWPEMTYGQYEEFKRARADLDNAEWGALGAWVRGGLEKVHVWHFTGL